MSFQRLPDDPAYWESLASRIEHAAWEQRAYGVSAHTADWLAMRAPVLMATSLAAAVVLAIWLSVAPQWSGRAAEASSWAVVLSPSDTVGRQIGATRPPSLGALIATTIPEKVRRQQ